VTDVMAMARDTASFTRSSGSGQLLALDADAATAVLGSTVGSGDVAGATGALLAARPAAPGTPLPGAPQRVPVNVTADLQSQLFGGGEDPGSQNAQPVTPATLPGVFW